MTRASSPKYTTGAAHRREWLDNGAVHARRAFGQDLSDSFTFAVTKYLVPICSGLQDDSKVILQTSLNDNELWWSRLRRKGGNCQWSDYLPWGGPFATYARFFSKKWRCNSISQRQPAQSMARNQIQLFKPVSKAFSRQKSRKCCRDSRSQNQLSCMGIWYSHLLLHFTI
jgi:hypothetical protein